MTNDASATATLAAAIIAAGASVLSLFFKSISSYRADLRAAHRQGIEPRLSELFESMYAIVARTTQAIAANDSQAKRIKWARADAEAGKLERLRLQLRLFLGETSEGIHRLILTPRTAKNCAGSPERIDHVVPLATDLRKTIETALRKAYIEGRFPSPGEESDIRKEGDRFLGFFAESRNWDMEAPEGAEPEAGGEDTKPESA
jgi:hypothetical protein